jgi:hypothetical protein
MFKAREEAGWKISGANFISNDIRGDTFNHVDGVDVTTRSDEKSRYSWLKWGASYKKSPLVGRRFIGCLEACLHWKWYLRTA